MIIYQILNVLDGKSYIGQSVRPFTKRYPAGKWWDNRYCPNEYLLNAAKKHGAKNFRVVILESNVTSPQELNRLEIEHISKRNTLYPNGYNLQAGGVQEDRLSPVFIEHIKEKAAKRYELKTYAGEIVCVLNLKKFCEANGLAYTALLNVIHGHATSSQGYGRVDTPIESIEKPSEYELVSPAGQVFKTRTLTSFAREHSLNPESLHRLFGSNPSSFTKEGWSRPSVDINKRTINFIEIVTVATGLIHRFITRKEAIRTLGLDRHRINKIVKGQTVDGFRLHHCVPKPFRHRRDHRGQTWQS